MYLFAPAETTFSREKIAFSRELQIVAIAKDKVVCICSFKQVVQQIIELDDVAAAIGLERHSGALAIALCNCLHIFKRQGVLTSSESRRSSSIDSSSGRDSLWVSEALIPLDDLGVGPLCSLKWTRNCDLFVAGSSGIAVVSELGNRTSATINPRSSISQTYSEIIAFKGKSVSPPPLDESARAPSASTSVNSEATADNSWKQLYHVKSWHQNPLFGIRDLAISHDGHYVAILTQIRYCCKICKLQTAGSSCILDYEYVLLKNEIITDLCWCDPYRILFLTTETGSMYTIQVPYLFERKNVTIEPLIIPRNSLRAESIVLLLESSDLDKISKSFPKLKLPRTEKMSENSHNRVILMFDDLECSVGVFACTVFGAKLISFGTIDLRFSNEDLNTVSIESFGITFDEMNSTSPTMFPSISCFQHFMKLVEFKHDLYRPMHDLRLIKTSRAVLNPVCDIQACEDEKGLIEALDTKNRLLEMNLIWNPHPMLWSARVISGGVLRTWKCTQQRVLLEFTDHSFAVWNRVRNRFDRLKIKLDDTKDASVKTAFVAKNKGTDMLIFCYSTGQIGGFNMDSKEIESWSNAIERVKASERAGASGIELANHGEVNFNSQLLCDMSSNAFSSDTDTVRHVQVLESGLDIHLLIISDEGIVSMAELTEQSQQLGIHRIVRFNSGIQNAAAIDGLFRGSVAVCNNDRSQVIVFSHFDLQNDERFPAVYQTKDRILRIKWSNDRIFPLLAVLMHGSVAILAEQPWRDENGFLASCWSINFSTELGIQRHFGMLEWSENNLLVASQFEVLHVYSQDPAHKAVSIESVCLKKHIHKSKLMLLTSMSIGIWRAQMIHSLSKKAKGGAADSASVIPSPLKSREGSHDHLWHLNRVKEHLSLKLSSIITKLRPESQQSHHQFSEVQYEDSKNDWIDTAMDSIEKLNSSEDVKVSLLLLHEKMAQLVRETEDMKCGNESGPPYALVLSAYLLKNQVPLVSFLHESSQLQSSHSLAQSKNHGSVLDLNVALKSRCFLWLKDVNSLCHVFEAIVRYKLQADAHDPIAVSLYLLVLKKKDLLLKIWSTLTSHSEKEKTVDFLKNDFTQEKWKQAARKNAFALLSKRRLEYAAAFFLLADEPSEAIDVCLRYMKNTDLALAVSRIFTGDKSKLTLSVVQVFSTQGNDNKDPFLIAWTNLFRNQNPFREICFKSLLCEQRTSFALLGCFLLKLLKRTSFLPITEVADESDVQFHNCYVLERSAKQGKEEETQYAAHKWPLYYESRILRRNVLLLAKSGYLLLAMTLASEWSFERDRLGAWNEAPQENQQQATSIDSLDEELQRKATRAKEHVITPPAAVAYIPEFDASKFDF